MMLSNKLKLDFNTFFNMYFPHSALTIVKFTDTGARYAYEGIPSEHDVEEKDFEAMHKFNKEGYGVYFTPNNVLEERGNGPTHAEDNFESVNAIYCDIDIEETKKCSTPECFAKRKDRKAEIAGHLLFLEVMASLVVETRNGFQCYWFTTCDREEFTELQEGLYQKFEGWGADPAARKVVQLMRMPGFLHNKEAVKCDIRWELCAPTDSDELKFYSKDILQHEFPVTRQDVPLWIKPKKINKKYAGYKVFKKTKDIFQIVNDLPIVDVFNRCNGTRLTGGEIFELMPPRGGKIQIRMNRRMTPNWIDVDKNLIFSNNVKGFCNIIHFAEYYGLSKKEIAHELKQIFNPEYMAQ